jgi:hypothetical protein
MVLTSLGRCLQHLPAVAVRRWWFHEGSLKKPALRVTLAGGRGTG